MAARGNFFTALRKNQPNARIAYATRMNNGGCESAEANWNNELNGFRLRPFQIFFDRNRGNAVNRGDEVMSCTRLHEIAFLNLDDFADNNMFGKIELRLKWLAA